MGSNISAVSGDVILIQSPNYEEAARGVATTLSALDTSPAERAARIELWRKQEWHGWFRWWLCARGTDWSKPIWIGLLVIGFSGLVLYGMWTGRWFVTAGGVVAWFTVVNLSFFTYFGLSLPGPPPAVPGPFTPAQRVLATMQLYPAGYNRRKLPRVRLVVPSNSGAEIVMELAVAKLDSELHALMEQQQQMRIQSGDAPVTQVVLETLPISRAEIDGGAAPVRVVAWSWDETRRSVN